MSEDKLTSVFINGAGLDASLKAAVQRVMASPDPTTHDVAAVQEIVDRKAQEIRAPISEIVRRIKMAG